MTFLQDSSRYQSITNYSMYNVIVLKDAVCFNPKRSIRCTFWQGRSIPEILEHITFEIHINSNAL